MADLRTAVPKAAFGLSLVLLLVGCGGEHERGDPTVMPSDAADSSALPTDGVPKVANPLDTTAIEADPCRAVTKAEIESVGSPVKGVEPDAQDPLGPECSWTLATGHGQVGAGPLTADSLGLSGVYAKHKKNQIETFKPVQSVNGYPGVIYGESDMDCALTVGVRDDLGYDVIFQAGLKNPNRGNTCPAAIKVAEFAIEHIKEMQ
ncbi:DUF3558 domain-containing protein [Amycolatopsis cihanbeyliensis]|uniref:Uncharacterized protein DUF3558 n=1 Tax=Amycolatopsis cihanbeyliensis TaxID=1128664 RepID=A0A542DL97_AMYCI|nr:DUF3558 domain-containing protein [Amycolatopsis cihanbeyliensis]TQJ03882.1 uncharacterized protein DUF3558 [Amycolatopsis cihanbeyliensis]